LRITKQKKKGKLHDMKNYWKYLLPALLALYGCGKESGPGLEAHDTKYIALGPDGQKLESGPGACVADSITGLVWESKSDTAGLHDWRNTYSWFNPDEATGELDYRGVQDGGVCEGSACDTWDYVLAVNGAGHCGYFDWRTPSRDELMSISDLRKAANPPTANMDFFTYMQPAEYWTGFDYSTQYQSAWAWNFFYGHDRVDWKKSPKFVRLVRGTAGELEAVKE
jgi:hypothetical protein